MHILSLQSPCELSEMMGVSHLSAICEYQTTSHVFLRGSLLQKVPAVAGPAALISPTYRFFVNKVGEYLNDLLTSLPSDNEKQFPDEGHSWIS
jgi:hypothetical protein